MSEFYKLKDGRKTRSKNDRGATVRKPATTEKKRMVLPTRALWMVLAAGIVFLGTLNIHDLYERIDRQRIEYVKIEGNLGNVTEDEIKEAVLGFTNHSMVALNLVQVKKELEKNPWIKSVSVRREWPATLIVNVSEQVAIARWGDDKLLNQDGEIFEPDAVLDQTQLPYLKGPRDTEQAVMQQYQKFTQLLYPLGLKVAELDLNSRGAWQLKLENGVVIKVGKNKVMEKMRRLVTFMDDYFIDQMVNIDSIDLRYSNGISVSKRKYNNENMVAL